MQIFDTYPITIPDGSHFFLKPGDLFFDIETTGLSFRRSHLYLIGAVFFDSEKNCFLLRQWFLDRPQEEPELLLAFSVFIASFSRLIHYNGTTFDLPYLQKKYTFYHQANPFDGKESLDLYQELRPCQWLFGLSSRKQKDLEFAAKLFRKDSYTGGELISVYQDFLLSFDLQKQKDLLLHNKEDLLGMLSLLGLFAYSRFLQGDFHLERCFFENMVLQIQLQTDYTFPSAFSVFSGPYRLTFQKNTACFTVSAEQATLKYFFTDYKDYFYLPLEDEAIHKSVGIFVDPSHRQKAKASNCYQKRTSCFLPQPKPIFSPAFRPEFKSSSCYFEWNDAFSQERFSSDWHTYLQSAFSQILSLLKQNNTVT